MDYSTYYQNYYQKITYYQDIILKRLLLQQY